MCGDDAISATLLASRPATPITEREQKARERKKYRKSKVTKNESYQNPPFSNSDVTNRQVCEKIGLKLGSFVVFRGGPRVSGSHYLLLAGTAAAAIIPAGLLYQPAPLRPACPLQALGEHTTNQPNFTPKESAPLCLASTAPLPKEPWCTTLR